MYNTKSSNINNEILKLNFKKDEIQIIKNYIIQNKQKNKKLPWYYLIRKNLPENVKDLSVRFAINKFLSKVPTTAEIQEFAFLLETSSKFENVEPNQRKINIIDLKEILNKMSQKIQNFLKCDVLFNECNMYIDEFRQLSTEIIIQYLTLKSNLMSLRAKLALYDKDCTGKINKKQMLEFLNNEVLDKIPAFSDLEENFQKFYCKTVISMFFFFLDYKNFGYCRISDMIVSGFLENIFVYQNLYSENNCGMYENWFSIEKTQELYSTFQMLDQGDKNYLTKEDFSRIGDGVYTFVFVNRLFEVHVAKSGLEMSYDEFILFQIAQEHLAHPSSIKYFFNILDINNNGYLTLFNISYFYKDLKPAYCNYVADADAMPEFHDYADLMFDMVNPIDINKVTLDDLIRCKKGHEFILNLINHYEFYRFEHKESDLGDDDDNLDSIMPDSENVFTNSLENDYDQNTSKDESLIHPELLDEQLMEAL